MMDPQGKTVIVVGLGASGVAAARLCLRYGAVRVIANDAAPRERLSAEAIGLGSEPGVELVAGGHDGVAWGRADLVVVSPGVRPLAAWDDAERAGVPVVGELEFAWSLAGGVPTVAVGGTNGKSTTTVLVGEMLRRAFGRVFVGGNLGTPLASALPGRGEAPPFDALVLEVSSFQAERMKRFRPQAAALLNVTADHLDRYPSFEAYAAAKGRMFAQMGPSDVAVVPAGDAVCLAEARRGEARVVTFGPGGAVEPEAGGVVDRARGERYEASVIALKGEHNLLNASAAVALAAAMGAGREAIAGALASIGPLPHRVELVGERGGVRYYDDSKGTNVGASVAALRGLAEARCVLIAGGRDKGGDYGPLVEALRAKGRALVLIGEAAERIERAAGGSLPVERASSMDDAVARASRLAEPGDAVLLSPACSSFDMFRDYHDRGQAFARAVRALGVPTPLAPLPGEGGKEGAAAPPLPGEKRSEGAAAPPLPGERRSEGAAAPPLPGEGGPGGVGRSGAGS
ncbi:MAG TPA: UDP-N-acetylmuramoyl-L-alanine--D-glutamate ligase [Polyangiaceae bacterium]|nr:UDP-N-acetylmuramoyl-L-alanine--D-glutamate ligase [Polyangiaceae bacterium]